MDLSAVNSCKSIPLAKEPTVASNVMTRKASSAIDDDLAALKQELASARRQRLRRQDAPVASDRRAEADRNQAPTVATQPGTYHADQATPEPLDLQPLIRELTNKLKSADDDVKAKVLDALAESGRQSFRTNLIVSVVLSTIFLIAGWLLSSAASPATLIALFQT
jgi:hypothetical protein